MGRGRNRNQEKLVWRGVRFASDALKTQDDRPTVFSMDAICNLNFLWRVFLSWRTRSMHARMIEIMHVSFPVFVAPPWLCLHVLLSLVIVVVPQLPFYVSIFISISSRFNSIHCHCLALPCLLAFTLRC